MEYYYYYVLMGGRGRKSVNIAYATQSGAISPIRNNGIR